MQVVQGRLGNLYKHTIHTFKRSAHYSFHFQQHSYHCQSFILHKNDVSPWQTGPNLPVHQKQCPLLFHSFHRFAVRWKKANLSILLTDKFVVCILWWVLLMRNDSITLRAALEPVWKMFYFLQWCFGSFQCNVAGSSHFIAITVSFYNFDIADGAAAAASTAVNIDSERVEMMMFDWVDRFIDHPDGRLCRMWWSLVSITLKVICIRNERFVHYDERR